MNHEPGTDDFDHGKSLWLEGGRVKHEEKVRSKETQITETDDDGQSVASGRGCPEKNALHIPGL